LLAYAVPFANIISRAVIPSGAFAASTAAPPARTSRRWGSRAPPGLRPAVPSTVP